MANLTKALLAETLMDMLRGKSLDKITVQDITDRCGLNRNTFYYHFDNVHDVMEWIFTLGADQILDKCIKTGDMETAIDEAAKVLYEHRESIFNIMNSVERKNIEDFIYDYLDEKLKMIILKMADNPNPDEEAVREVAILCKYSIAGSILKWIDDGMPEISDASVRNLCGIFMKVINRALS